MIVFDIIMLLILVVAIIIGYSISEQKETSTLLIGCSMTFGVFFFVTITEAVGLTVHKSNEKGYNVWKEETKIGDKVVKTTWHVAPKK